jgi:hypothetical protein
VRHRARQQSWPDYYAFRLFVRGVIQHGDGFTPAETTSYLNAAQAQTFTQTLVALGVVAADGRDLMTNIGRAIAEGLLSQHTPLV